MAQAVWGRCVVRCLACLWVSLVSGLRIAGCAPSGSGLFGRTHLPRFPGERSVALVSACAAGPVSPGSRGENAWIGARGLSDDSQAQFTALSSW